MALKITTAQPTALLRAIKHAIDQGHVDTWKYDSDGDFTHTPPQWANKAWLRPSVRLDGLELTIIPPNNTQISREVYAVYHGRFIEMVLSHFDQQFTDASATALAAVGDLLGVAR